jgi:hypothetical protein
MTKRMQLTTFIILLLFRSEKSNIFTIWWESNVIFQTKYVIKLQNLVSADNILTLCMETWWISWYNLYWLVVNITWDMVKWPHLRVVIWCNCWEFLCNLIILPLIRSLLQFHSSCTLSMYRNKFTIEIKTVN